MFKENINNLLIQGLFAVFFTLFSLTGFSSGIKSKNISDDIRFTKTTIPEIVQSQEEEKNLKQKNYNLSAYKLAPAYFIANKPYGKNQNKLIPKNPEVIAFVQTIKGKVQFTPKGAYIGMLIPKNPIEKEKSLQKKDKLKAMCGTPEERFENGKPNTKLIVMGLGFKNTKNKTINPYLEGKTKSTVNYLKGKKENWVTNIPTFQKLIYPQVWNNIDLEYIGHLYGLEYRIIIYPGGDPNEITMTTGGEKLTIDDNGNLKVELAGGTLHISRPKAYQETEGKRKEVDVKFKILESGNYGFELGNYDKSKPLIIDPLLNWSTYLGGESGGSSEEGLDIAVDSSGNAYVVGYTQSFNFPVTNGAFEQTNNGIDAFVSKFYPDGSCLIFSTYLGGSDMDYGSDIKVDTSGNVYVIGVTKSSDFPVTTGAYNENHNGDSSDFDIFVSELSPSGSSLLYSTYLGGNDYDYGYSITVDSSGNVYVTGKTNSSNFPVTSGAFDINYKGNYDAFVTKLSSDGSSLVYSTFLGGNGQDIGWGIDIDDLGNTYITGETQSPDFPVTEGGAAIGAYDTTFNGDHDAFVSKLSSDGSSLVYSTYLGGSGTDEGYAIAVDSSGNAYITGRTTSTNFPITSGAYNTTFNGAWDGFITKLNSDGISLVYSTYLGGNNHEKCLSIAIDTSDNAYVTGWTGSTDFPTTAEAYDVTYNGGYYEAFVTKLNHDGSSLIYSTFLGGNNSDQGNGIALDNSGNAYITGWTKSNDFPVTNRSYDTSFNGGYDVFISKLSVDGSSLIFSTFLGGNTNDLATSIEIDGYNNVYLTGITCNINFPTTTGTYDETYNNEKDSFVAKLNSNGSSLIYSTFLGGSDNDYVVDIDIDSSGNAYVAGYTWISDFPTTNGAFNTTLVAYVNSFVSKLSSDGSYLVYSTFLGGSIGEYCYGIKVDSAGNAYVVGETSSSDFPVTSGAYDTTFNGGSDVYITKLSPNGSSLIYSTFLGGSYYDEGYDIAIDTSGNAYVIGNTNSSDFPVTSGAYDETYNGSDIFVSKLNPDGSSLIYSTFLGGSNRDFGEDIAIDSFGNAYVAGETWSADFPVTSGAYNESFNGGKLDIFVSKLSSDGASLVYSTFLGGSEDDRCHQIVLNSSANAYLTGSTLSPDFPVTSGAYDESYNGEDDAFITKLNSDGSSLLFSTYLGGSDIDNGIDIAIDSSENTYVIGDTLSSDFPVTIGSYDTTYNGGFDVFITKLSTSFPPIITDARGDSVTKVAPFKAIFTCNAYDSDGGEIVRYIWHINGLNFSDTVTTYEGKCRYVFNKADTYHINVTVEDDEGKTATATLKDDTGEETTIVIKDINNYRIVIPLSILGFTKSIHVVNSISNILNITNKPVNLKINYYDADGNYVKADNYTIEPKGKFNYNPNTYNSDNYPYALAEADNYVLAYAKVVTDSGQMTSYLLPQYSDKLYVPHIAEERDWWETSMFVSSLEPTDLKVKVGTNEANYNIPMFSTVINLEELLGDEVIEEKTWGKVEIISDNPFGNSQSLSGFEIFQHNDTDGAGVELQSSGSTTLFIPHIPEETDIFWTGFAIVNPNDEAANLKVDLYTKDGELVDTVNLTIPAQEKLKGLAGDLFGDAYGNAEWGIIRSNKEIFGIEIYGTVASGICGYSLPTIATTEGYLPELISGDNYWNGIAITNPTNEDATVTISLASSDGTIKSQKTIQLGSMQRFKSVVKDFFDDAEIDATDYIYYHSTTSVLAIEVSGDLDRTFMFSLIGKE